MFNENIIKKKGIIFILLELMCKIKLNNLCHI